MVKVFITQDKYRHISLDLKINYVIIYLAERSGRIVILPVYILYSCKALKILAAKACYKYSIFYAHFQNYYVYKKNHAFFAQ